ncbi:MAG: hypothetical protein RL211_1291 [Pseudomonadota bacterium]|jgi:uncharacterized protein YdbL (DUF1318 family)
MTNSYQNQIDIQQDRYGLQVAARLSAGTQGLPHDISERLRASRYQALAKRKIEKTQTAASVAGSASLTYGDEGLNFWSTIASALPLIALAIGLFTISAIQDDDTAREIANVDTALLTDDLPPEAYADPGFLQFVKSGQNLGQ